MLKVRHYLNIVASTILFIYTYYYLILLQKYIITRIISIIIGSILGRLCSLNGLKDAYLWILYIGSLSLISLCILNIFDFSHHDQNNILILTHVCISILIISVSHLMTSIIIIILNIYIKYKKYM